MLLSSRAEFQLVSAIAPAKLQTRESRKPGLPLRKPEDGSSAAIPLMTAKPISAGSRRSAPPRSRNPQQA